MAGRRGGPASEHSGPIAACPQHIRIRIFERDHGQCQLQYPGCLGLATEIDDIIPASLLRGSPASRWTTTTGKPFVPHAIPSRPSTNGWPRCGHLSSAGTPAPAGAEEARGRLVRVVIA
jgi:hypothetical protein